ncbi:MAG: nuclease-related domain-containing protein [Chloroflexota bacterium]
MQIIQSTTVRRPSERGDVLRGLLVGGVLFVGAIILGFLIFGTPFLSQFTPSGRPAPGEILAGIAAWSFALTAPAGFGLAGAVRLATVLDQATTRPRVTPALRAAAAIGEDCSIATRVRLPDGRLIPELVIGPFGVAVIEELPPPAVSRHRGESWEARTVDGQWVPIENPLERAGRDADRIRRWFADGDQDFVVKVHAAVVAPDDTISRTPSCAVITAAQLPAWLASLPVQRSLSPDRREEILDRLRQRV